MRILITGATGFIGSHVVRELVSRGHETYAMVRPSASLRRLGGVRDRVNLVEVDLDDAPRVTGLLGDIRPAAIVHLAWYTEPGRYLRATAENVASLGTGARLLVAAADSGCPRLVLAGTCLERADVSEPPVYATSKSALHLLSAGFRETGLSVVCGHVFYLFGPWEDERRVIPSVIRALLRSESIATTDGLQHRDYLHVTDVASAFCSLAETSLTGGVDICSGAVVTLREVFEIIGDETNRRDLIRFGDLGSSTDQDFPATGNPEPLRSLDWGPPHDLRAAIIDTIDWWRSEEGQS